MPVAELVVGLGLIHATGAVTGVGAIAEPRTIVLRLGSLRDQGGQGGRRLARCLGFAKETSDAIAGSGLDRIWCPTLALAFL